MARPKGSKNKSTEDVESEVEVDELLGEEPTKEDKKEKKLLGYHPITGEEVWLE